MIKIKEIKESETLEEALKRLGWEKEEEDEEKEEEKKPILWFLESWEDVFII